MRLLLVEDEKRMAQALCEILRQEKYEVAYIGLLLAHPYPSTLS